MPSWPTANLNSNSGAVPWLRLRAFLLSLFSYVKVPTHTLWQKVPVILAAWEPEIGGSQVLSQPGKLGRRDFKLKLKKKIKVYSHIV